MHGNSLKNILLFLNFFSFFSVFSFNELMKFPKNFIWGANISAPQTEGDEGSNGKNNWNTDPNRPNIGDAAGYWRFYKEDAKRARHLGLDSKRISIEWSKVMPEPGVFNTDAMKHYVDVIDALIEQGISPVVCLFHHTWPEWLKNGLLTQEGIDSFVAFAKYVSDNLGTKVTKYWIFNEPEGYALYGFFVGEYPPGKQQYPDLKTYGMPDLAVRLKAAGLFLRNCIVAHCLVAEILREKNPEVEIGIVKVVNQVKAYHPFNPLEGVAARLFDYLLNDVILNVFQTGDFWWPFLGKERIEDAPNSLTQIGISYYTHSLLNSLKGFKPTTRPGMPVSDSGKEIYPQGIYEAIKRVARVGKPIIIAENGIADAKDVLGIDYMKAHLAEVYRAIQDGFDVRGYYVWSFIDTAGWPKKKEEDPYSSRYGLWAVDFAHPDKIRTLRARGAWFRDFIAQQKA